MERRVHATLDSGRTLERHYFVAEDLPLVAEQLYFLLGHVPTGGKQVHDANIVATMIAYDVRTLPPITLLISNASAAS